MREKMEKVADEILEDNFLGDKYLKVRWLREALSQYNDDDVVVIQNMYAAEKYAGWETWAMDLSEKYRDDFRTKVFIISFNPNIELPDDAFHE